MTNLDQFTRAPQGSFKLQRKLLAATVAACFGVAQANPTLPQVVAGQATFAQQGNVFSITNTPNTIINWQSFSVGRDEITRFIQQSSDSKVLNRITGQDPSQILGSLQSNGQVFLINPNGVLFGKDARIDVNGLVASSLQLSNADFLAGKHNFNGEAGAGKVVNQGSITTPQGGKVFLIAPTVENHGVISAPNGEILLAAGKSVQLVDSANPAITVVVSAPEDQALNLGQIVAQGGRVGIYGALVSQRGVVNANSAVRGENGKIILKASRSTLLEAGSQTTASGAGKGGEIQILGQNVALNGDARVDASGREGGGTVLLGGDYQGKNSAVQNARQAFIGKNAVIRADAEASGDGGKVIVWADESTRAYGAISARSAGGKGGFVETSGHYLDVAGLRVDTTGLDATGVWLLDPYNIEVVGAGYGNGYGLADVADFSGGVPATATTKIEASLINNASSNVVLQATNDISINTAVNMTAAGKSFTAYAGNDINVNANLQTNGGAIGLYANYAPSGSASGHGAVNLAGSRTINSGAADITLSGISVNLNGSVTATPGGARVGDDAPLISLRANNLDIADTGSVNNSAGEGGYVSIAPFVSTYNMSIMGADSPSAGTMVLQAADLGRVNAYELALGGASVGEVSIYAPLDLHANLVVDAKSAIQHSGSIDANGHSVFFNVYDDTGSINGNYGTFADVDTLRFRSNGFTYSGVANSIVANHVYVDKTSLDGVFADISLGGTNPAGAYLSESELKMFDAPLIDIGTTAGYAGQIQVSESLNLLGSKAAADRSATRGTLTLKGAGIALYSSVSVDSTLKLTANAISQNNASPIMADELVVAAPAANVYLTANNQVNYLSLTAKSINYSSGIDTTIDSLVQSDPLGFAQVTLNGDAETLTIGDAVGSGSVNLSAPVLNVADGGKLQGSYLNISADRLNIDGTGKIKGNYLNLNTGADVTVGATLGVVEGGMLLNSATLAKMDLQSLFVESDGNMHVWDTDFGDHFLGLSAHGTLYSHGTIAAKGIALYGGEFDFSAGGAINPKGFSALFGTTKEGGRLSVGATAESETTVISAADLNKVNGSLHLMGDKVTVAEALHHTSGSVTIGASEGAVAINAALSTDTSHSLNIDAHGLSFGSSGSLSGGSVSINAYNHLHLGNTLAAVEGGLQLNQAMLDKITTPTLYVSSKAEQDVTLYDLTLAGTFLSVSADGALVNQGDVSAQGISLRAHSFDLTQAGTSIAATGTYSNVAIGTNGILQVNGSSASNTVIDSAVLSKITAGSVQFDGTQGLVVAGAVTKAGAQLNFTSSVGSVDFQAPVDVGTGSLTVQSNAMNLGSTLTANNVTLAPLTAYNVRKGIVVGGTGCGAVTDCLHITQLGNVNAATVNIGIYDNTSTIKVAGIQKGDGGRHAATSSIGLTAAGAITQSGAIDVGTLYVNSAGSVTLNDAGNTISNLGLGRIYTSASTYLTATDVNVKTAGNLNTLLSYASGTVTLDAGGSLSSSGYLTANKLIAIAVNGIGTDSVPFLSKVSFVDAMTTASSGTSSINISNNTLSERQAVRVDRLQVQSGNAGSITFSNYGATTIAAGDSAGTVRTGSGAISITAHSPLRVEGKVVSQSGAITLEAGTSSVPTEDVLTLVGSGVRVQSGGTVRLVGSNAVDYTSSQVSGSTVTTVVAGVVVTPPVSPPPSNPPPVDPPPVDPPPVDPPPVDPPPVDPPPTNPPPTNPPPTNPPPTNPPPVDPPPVNPPPVDPPPVNPPPVDPPPVNPPPVNPPPVNPPPTADICTIAPNSALCQVLSPPTANEPVKPVQAATREVIKTITREGSAPGSASSSGSSGKGTDSSGGPAATDKDEQKKAEKETAATEKQGTQNEKPAAKTYCN